MSVLVSLMGVKSNNFWLFFGLLYYFIKLGGCDISKYLILSKIEYKKVTLIAKEEDLSAESIISIIIVTTSNSAYEEEAEFMNYCCFLEIK